MFVGTRKGPSRVLLPIAALLVLVANDHLSQLLLLLLLDRLFPLLDHLHLLVVLHHFCQIVVWPQIRNTILLEHLPSLHRRLNGSFVAILSHYLWTSTRPILS